MSSALISVPVQDLEVLVSAVKRVELLRNFSYAAAGDIIDPCTLLEALADVYSASQSLVGRCSKSGGE